MWFRIFSLSKPYTAVHELLVHCELLTQRSPGPGLGGSPGLAGLARSWGGNKEVNRPDSRTVMACGSVLQQEPPLRGK